MIVSKKEAEKLAEDIRNIIDGKKIDLRDNLEGRLSIIKNEVHTLANRLNEQAESLENDKRKLTDTLADISHQLKTPLTSMKMMVELLEDAPKEKTDEFILNLKQGLTQTNWLVNSLLKMAKLDSGTVLFNPTEIKTNELIELATLPLKILLDIKNQEIIKPASDIILTCDKNWTAEALTNIIKNALEHSPSGSKIVVETGKNPLSTWISVADSGNGLTNAKIKNLFNRFESSIKGTGIGLPLALKIMQEQQGDIEISNKNEGNGVIFTLKFYT